MEFIKQQTTETIEINSKFPEKTLNAEWMSYDKNVHKVVVPVKTQSGIAFEMGEIEEVLVYLNFSKGSYGPFEGKVEDIEQKTVSFAVPEEVRGQTGNVTISIMLKLTNDRQIDLVQFEAVARLSKIDQDTPAIQEFYVPLFEDLVESVTTDLNADVALAKSKINQSVTETQNVAQVEQGKIQEELPKLQVEFDELQISWEEFVEQNREIIESIDPGGVVLTELIDARKPEDKASFNNLARRLDFTDQTTLVANSAAQYNTDPRTKFIAHRGHEAVCPENTMKAFELAFLAGYDGIETDAQRSADGIWYCFHDDTVDRMTNGTGVFTDLTSAQINQLIIDAGNGVSVYPGERIPTLESCLSYCKKVGLYPQIELKKFTNDSDLESFCNLMKKYGFNNNQGTILCNYTAALGLRNYWPEAFLTVFYTNTPEFDKHVFSNTPYTAVGIEQSLLLSDISVLDKYKSKGVRVGTYTITQSLYESVKKLGLDFIGGNVVE